MNDLYYQPRLFSQFPELIAVQSTRKGGISPVPYDSLNLGLYTEDLTENVQANRQLFWKTLGILENQVAHSYQTHEDKILEVKKGGKFSGYDALFTRQKDVFLAISTADCVPIFIYDPKTATVAAIHAGWRGVVNEIVPKTIQKLINQYALKAQDLYVYIGTCISEEYFEVGEEVAQKFNKSFIYLGSNQNKYKIDLKLVIENQLLALKILPFKIEKSIFCTAKNNDIFFSHRLEKGTTGRMLSVIGMKS